ncbi:hypothetical protein Lal_00001271 [Lupinus albus]|nr:hypothetical protein Lal_00001271 [Lupinus albus]
MQLQNGLPIVRSQPRTHSMKKQMTVNTAIRENNKRIQMNRMRTTAKSTHQGSRSVALSFNALIKVGEKIEGRIRNGKLTVDQSKSYAGKKPNFMKKKEGEAHVVFTDPKGYKPQNFKYQAQTSVQPTYNTQASQNYNPPQVKQPQQTFNQTHPYYNQSHNPERKIPQFDHIPMSYAEQYSHLLRERMITPAIRRVLESPGAWFDPNVSCAYHSGVIGHSIEHCRALKYKVQNLIDLKQLDFKLTAPDVDKNPLPNHGNQGVNIVEKVQDEAFVWEVTDVRTPMRIIFQEMCQREMVEKLVDDEGPDSCEWHGAVAHTLEECPEFKLLLQKMLDMRLITIERGPSYKTVNATTKEG